MERLDAATLRAVREAQSGNPPARLKAQPMPESLKRRTGMTQTRVSDALRGGGHDGALSAGVFMPTE